MEPGSDKWDGAKRMPVGYVGHGNPVLAIDTKRGFPLKDWGRTLPTPTAFLLVSSRWEHVPLTIDHSEAHNELFYDFGMPYEELYRVKYPVPGVSELTDTLEKMLTLRYRYSNYRCPIPWLMLSCSISAARLRH